MNFKLIRYFLIGFLLTISFALAFSSANEDDVFRKSQQELLKALKKSPLLFRNPSKKDDKDSDKTVDKNSSETSKKKISSNKKKTVYRRKKVKKVSVAPGKCTKEFIIDSVISSGTVDNVDYALRLAQRDECSSLLLLINTPGGSVVSTRKIVESILKSRIPVLCLVHPFGAHAGSAGAILLQACHVNGAIETTNLGAATPIFGSGGNLPEDLRNKMINDLSSWLDSLTELRDRNKQFGRDIISSATAVNAKEAFELGAIDFFGKTKEDFLKFAHGYPVRIQNEDKKTPVLIGKLESISRGIRYYFVNFITDPELIYLLFIGSLLLIYFELTHAGFILPGVLGVMGLIVAFVGMHKLSFVWGGALLIILGLIFMVLEVFITSFGILGISGVVSFIIGSLFLFDPSKTGGLTIPLSTIAVTTVVFSAISIGIAYLALATLRKGNKTEEEKWVGQEGEVVKVESDSKGLFEIHGETWKYKSDQRLKEGDMIQIVSYSDLIFKVKKIDQQG